MKCELCNKEFNDSLSLSRHISRNHKCTTKKYYDDFLKKENEGVCIICGDVSKFYSFIKGYSDVCSRKCSAINNRRKLKENKEKYLNFINKVSCNQKQIWKDREINGEKNNIRRKISDTYKKTINKLTKKERIEKYGYLNKLKGYERENFIFKITKPLFDFRLNASENELREVIEKMRETKLGNRYYKDIMESFIFYKNEVRLLTEKTYRRFKKIINPNGHKRSRKSDGYQLDHKFSIVEGFRNNIKPEIISSVFNLEIIKSLENNKKNYNCSITKKELFDLYYG